MQVSVSTADVRGVSVLRDIRGIGFIEYAEPRDAADAQRELDRMFLDGREVRLCAAGKRTLYTLQHMREKYCFEGRSTIH